MILLFGAFLWFVRGEAFALVDGGERSGGQTWGF